MIHDDNFECILADVMHWVTVEQQMSKGMEWMKIWKITDTREYEITFLNFLVHDGIRSISTWTLVSGLQIEKNDNNIL